MGAILRSGSQKFPMTKLTTEGGDEPTAILLPYELHIKLVPYYQWHCSFFGIVCEVY